LQATSSSFYQVKWIRIPAIITEVVVVCGPESEGCAQQPHPIPTFDAWMAILAATRLAALNKSTTLEKPNQALVPTSSQQ